MKMPPGVREYLKVTATYAHRGTDKAGEPVSKECLGAAATAPDPDLVNREAMRLKVATGLRMCLDAVKLTAKDKLEEKEIPLERAQEIVEGMLDMINDAGDPPLDGLREDLTGQVS